MNFFGRERFCGRSGGYSRPLGYSRGGLRDMRLDAMVLLVLLRQLTFALVEAVTLLQQRVVLVLQIAHLLRQFSLLLKLLLADAAGDGRGGPMGGPGATPVHLCGDCLGGTLVGFRSGILRRGDGFFGAFEVILRLGDVLVQVAGTLGGITGLVLRGANGPLLGSTRGLLQFLIADGGVFIGVRCRIGGLFTIYIAFLLFFGTSV